MSECRLVNYKQAGALLGLSPKVLRRLIAQRKLSGRKEGKARAISETEKRNGEETHSGIRLAGHNRTQGCVLWLRGRKA
jgi:hypothetical protein